MMEKSSLSPFYGTWVWLIWLGWFFTMVYSAVVLKFKDISFYGESYLI